MARPRTFDEAAVRRGALAAFLRDGYAATSLSALEDATGLDRRQLYNSFGDKQAMFTRALDDFAELAGARFLAPLEAPGAGAEAVRSVLHAMTDFSATPEGRCGCLFTNTAREPVARDSAVEKRLDAFFERIRLAYRNALSGAAESAAPDRRTDPEDLSHFFLSVHLGLCVMARAGLPAESLSRAAEEASKRIA